MCLQSDRYYDMAKFKIISISHESIQNVRSPYSNLNVGCIRLNVGIQSIDWSVLQLTQCSLCKPPFLLVFYSNQEESPVNGTA